ncbi:hypothetical protein [Rhizobium mongolense]|uniref:Uncharacterized protein n=1 Tax=Rhizobium mongolense TaxID=57676 RepID=A0A7W6WBV1_9HYPH|nr:hypothetical protein [Rhizobium mongolense]MBB4272331.1 hypothetical protein [Rhizobium mongolense]
MTTLTTSWNGHPGLPAYIDFLEWALRHEETRQAFRRSTGNAPIPAGERLQRFSDWVEANLYGRPEDFPAEAEAA